MIRKQDLIVGPTELIEADLLVAEEPVGAYREYPLLNEVAYDAQPFVKWVGGKRSLMSEITRRMPIDIQHYYEPFIGGGAVFFQHHKLFKNRGFISDLNPDLVKTYQVIRDEVDALIVELSKYAKQHCKEFYYEMRKQHHLRSKVKIAARFIYLNKTCFNGLYRVNKSGEFNVPMGNYTNPGILQEENLRACHLALQGVDIQHQGYLAIKPKVGDFVYFDPPYHPLNATSFTAYSKYDFSEYDQQELATFARSLHDSGVKVMLSNSDAPFIRELYSSFGVFNIHTVYAPRMVNRNADGRGAVSEVLITNY